MDRTEAAGDVVQLLQRERSGRFVEVLPDASCWVTDDGVLAQVGESSFTVGFGVRTGLAVTGPLLHEVDSQCRLNVVGHLWLTPGTDDDNWSIIWGLKLLYSWCDDMTVLRVLFDCLSNRSGLIEMMTPRLAPYGGSDYWDSMNAATGDEVRLGAAGLVLAGHLG